MATFQKELSAPQATGGVVPPVQSSGATRTVIDGLSSLLGVVGKGMQTQDRQAERDKLQADAVAKGQVIGATQTGILDLEDERNAQALARRELTQETTSIHSDGEVTPEEQKQLDRIEKQNAKFNLLDPLKFQTRRNAFQKQVLNDTANLAIQPQINALFQQGRSQVSAPISTGEEQLNAKMDSIYGVGNWTPSDAGREVGNAIYLDNIQKQGAINFTAIADQGNLSMMMIGNSALAQLNTKLASQGALSDDDKNLYTTSLIGAATDAKLKVQQQIIANRKNGIDITAQANTFMSNIDDTTNGFLNLVKSEEAFGSRVDYKNVMSSAVTIVNSTNSLRNSKVAAVTGGIMGGGSGDGIIMAAQMLQQGDAAFEAVISNLPPALQLNTSVADLKASYAEVIYSVQNSLSIKDLATTGAINKNIALMVSAKGVGKAKEKEEVKNYLNATLLTAYEDVGSIMDRFVQPEVVSNLTNTKEAPIAQARHFLEVILTRIPDGERKHMSIDDNGKIQVNLPSRGRTGVTTATYTNTLLDKYNTFLDTYSDSLGDKKQFTDVLMETESKE